MKNKVRTYFSYINELYKNKKISKAERDRIMNTYYSNRNKMSSPSGSITIKNNKQNYD